MCVCVCVCVLVCLCGHGKINSLVQSIEHILECSNKVVGMLQYKVKVFKVQGCVGY